MRAGLVVTIVGGWALFARPADAEPAPCVPSARLGGEPALVDRIASELAVLGIASDAVPERCPVVVAQVARDDAGIRLVLRDPAGRLVRRTVTDAAVAATVIESWARSDIIGAPLLAARALGGPGSALRPAASVQAPAGDRERSTRHPLYLSAHIERHYVDDDSEWRALGIAGCARVSGLCLGGELRVADDHGFTQTGSVTEFQRLDGAALATADLPIAVGRTVVAPGIGVGIGWLQTSRDETEPSPMCNPDGTCDPAAPGDPSYIGDGWRRRTLGVRFAVRLAARVPLASRLWLDLGVAAEVNPSAERDPGNVPLGSDPAMPMDTPDVPPPAPIDVLPLDPSHQFRFGVGVGVGFE